MSRDKGCVGIFTMSVQPGSSARLADFLPYLLSITSNAVSERIAAEYRSRFDLKVPEWRVMAVLGDAGAMTQRDLTAMTLMDKVAVNRACKVLEERGFATRQPNTDDGRSHLLALSGQGVDIYMQVMPLARDMEQQVFSALTDAEILSFKKLLDRVRAQANLLAGE